MKILKDKILIVGGYGAVGKVVSENLAKIFPDKVIIAGRNRQKACDFIFKYKLSAIPAAIDLSTNYFEEINFEQIHTAISCIEYLQDDGFILKCIQHHVHYTELATSYEAFLRLIGYKEEVEKSKLCLIPGVGLMPGLSGIFAQHALLNLKKINEVQSFVLLGLAEDHGLDALRWMIETAGKTFTLKTKFGQEQVKSFTDPIKMRLLNEDHHRKFYRFNFGDQHIIKNFMRVQIAETRLAFDSWFVTWLIVVLGKIGLLKWLNKLNPQTIKKWLSKFRIGSEVFAVQTHCYGENKSEVVYMAKGINEARATGVIASYAVRLLYQMNRFTGIQRLEEITDFEDLTQYLQKNKISISIKNYKQKNML
jgi:saccharopine dehydrogenase-like NADP-dependent oxidoreductase